MRATTQETQIQEALELSSNGLLNEEAYDGRKVAGHISNLLLVQNAESSMSEIPNKIPCTEGKKRQKVDVNQSRFVGGRFNKRTFLLGCPKTVTLCIHSQNLRSL